MTVPRCVGARSIFLSARSAAAVFLSVSIALGACGDGQVVDNARHVVVEGRLQGRMVDGMPCLWIVQSSGDLVYLGLPVGWDEGTTPLRVIDSQGAVVAEVGDMVRGEANVGMIAGETCAPGKVPLPLDTLVKL